jgi:hypothetical protein
MNISITQTLRPIRLAIFIKPKRESYIRAVHICSSYWGGKHFPIIPLYNKFSRAYREEYGLYTETPVEFYSHSLDNFNPDVLVLDDGIKESDIIAFRNNREVITIKEIETALSAGGPIYGISALEVLALMKKDEFKYKRTDNLRLCCPEIVARDLFSLTLCGGVDGDIHQRIKEAGISENNISFPKIGRSNLQECLGEETLNYLSITTYGTNVFRNTFWSGRHAIFVVDSNNLNDLINIWNYRALGWKFTVLLSDDLENPFFKSEIIKQQFDPTISQSIHDIISVIGPHKEDHDRIVQFLREITPKTAGARNCPLYSFQHWLPRFWETGEYLRYDRAASIYLQSASDRYQVSTENGYIQLDLKSPPFQKLYLRHIKPRYINDFSLQFDDPQLQFAEVIPLLPRKELQTLISGSRYNQWVASPNGLAYFASEQEDKVSMTIPASMEVAEAWFLDKGAKIKMSSAGKLGSQLLKSIGGIYGTNFLVNQGIRPVLQLFENGKVVLKDTLLGEIKKQWNQKRFQTKDAREVISHLIHKKIIEFGVELQCPFCQQRSFYMVTDLSNQISCTICHNKYHLPSDNPDDIKWAYRGLGPFSRGNKADGLLSVLLALRFFKISMNPSKVTALFSFEVLNKSVAEHEVDMAIFYNQEHSSSNNPDLFLLECKTQNKFEKKDIDKMKQLGRRFPGAILVFATLKIALSPEEVGGIRKLVNFFRRGNGPRPINPVMILTGNELLPNSRFNPLASIETLLKSNMRYDDEIGFTADATCVHYLQLRPFHELLQEKFDAIRKKHMEKNAPEAK